MIEYKVYFGPLISGKVGFCPDSIRPWVGVWGIKTSLAFYRILVVKIDEERGRGRIVCLFW